MKYFDEYVSNYDMSDPDINYKYYHSYRVMDVMELLATKLNMSEKDIHLAKVIGLLHDIGRFEQDKLFNSFKDSKFDHGNYGVEVLKKTNLLDKTNIDKSDYEVVYKAVDNHNQFKIDEGLTERELLFSKLVRDADKLDILYVLGNPDIKGILKQDESKLSESLTKDFFDNKPGNVKDVKSKNDSLSITFGYIYESNFKESYQIIYENKYNQKKYERKNRKDIFKEFYDYTIKYIEERID